MLNESDPPYIPLRAGRIASTRQYADVHADYDSSGRLLGVLLLGPVNPKIVEALVARGEQRGWQTLA